jgi:hypothetical protein
MSVYNHITVEKQKIARTVPQSKKCNNTNHVHSRTWFSNSQIKQQTLDRLDRSLWLNPIHKADFETDLDGISTVAFILNSDF